MTKKITAAIPLLRGILILGLCAAVFPACGYTLRGSGRFLADKNIKTVYVPLFKNSTTRFEIDLKLTEAVINEFVTRGGVKVVQTPEAADATLEGEVLAFGVNPIAYSGNQGSADRYSIIISTSVTLRELKTNTVVFSNPNYVYRGEYQVEEGMDFESQETEAMSEIAELFARNLVIYILEGF
ncbi:MAG: LPS assembly lipoprotein LptE [Candidatus Aminicenantales bacterium]